MIYLNPVRVGLNPVPVACIFEYVGTVPPSRMDDLRLLLQNLYTEMKLERLIAGESFKLLTDGCC
jgi:hypothetical protein